MQLNPSEISDLIKQRIENFEADNQARSEGTIVSLNDGIVRIHGLAEAMQGEMIELPGDTYALALNLERDSVGAVVLGHAEHLAEGDVARCTGRILEVPVGEALLGRVVNALGEPIDGKGPINTETLSPIEKVAPGVIERQGVDQPVQTGIKSIDAMVPIGRGQRELIIGDRQTGKTAVAIDAIINQKDTGVKCIYVAIGQKQSSIANVVRKLEEHGAMDHTIVVAAGAADPAVMQFISAYTGCAMGEYFRDRGEDALIVYDDLSKQAVAYRQVSLLLRRPPGREAFPGDVFYIHSRLLERAARINAEEVERLTNGEIKGKTGSLTALIVYDDLSKQAVAYRQVSLLLRRPPGREAFPGDVFYIHSRLLERAARINAEEVERLTNGEIKGKTGSLTALPIIETQAGDVSAFVPTNVISITDGQIFLETDLFNSGIRPAINAGLSVSRVGGSAQTKIIKKLGGGIRLALAQYRELAAFAQFASDLDDATRAQLERGQRVTELMKQLQYSPMSVADMALSLFAIEKGFMDDIDLDKILAFEKGLLDHFASTAGDLRNQINETGNYDDEIQAGLKKVVEDFKTNGAW